MYCQDPALGVFKKKKQSLKYTGGERTSKYESGSYRRLVLATIERYNFIDYEVFFSLQFIAGNEGESGESRTGFE
jgi:hypothetical protein